MHHNQGRAYLKIKTYVQAGKPLMDAMGVKTIMLFTDSRGAIEEAMRYDIIVVC